MAVTPSGLENYILKNGETNVIPLDKWGLGNFPRFVRVVDKGNMPNCGLASCYGKDCGCTWWREFYHRKIAWQATYISNSLLKAKQKVKDVADFDSATKISKLTYLGDYITPICVALQAFNEYIAKTHFRDRFNCCYGQGSCGGFPSRCKNGYYPVQYWEDFELAACLHLKDLLNELENHMIDLKIDKDANKTPEQLWLALQGAKQKPDLYIGKGGVQWKNEYKDLGGALTWKMAEPRETFAGVGEGGSADGSILDDLLAKELLSAKSDPAPINPLLIAGGLGLLAVVALTNKKKGA